MPPSALLNLTHGQRKNGAASAIDQAQQVQAQRTQSTSYANATGRQSGFNQGQGQYGLYQRNSGANNSGYQDNKAGSVPWSICSDGLPKAKLKEMPSMGVKLVVAVPSTQRTLPSTSTPPRQPQKYAFVMSKKRATLRHYGEDGWVSGFISALH